MHDALGMGSSQSFRQLHAQALCFPAGERTMHKFRAQGHTRDQLHGQEVHSVRRAEFINRFNVRVI